ncbi:ribonuclease T1 [Pedobacter cryoconitis]|uniref:Ribonuclease n=1 Tax=Pedobacter cryoconitis TaxID=188932 RepID=A0A7W9DZT6_9SPHI|nr:ribonuclease domain-containing protein [Pedobacter cryoconitis]MBB5635890.1 ribonuclease T1 [Pedobacter cryoconitis]MBB6273211.1 ribonuclease T1 [Pedobacter cryoconitis]
MRILLTLITCCVLLFSCRGAHSSNDQTISAQQNKTAISTLSSTDTDAEDNIKVAGVPQKAYTVAAYVAKNNKAPQGYVGGTVFQNREGRLPPGVAYKEYDINPKVRGKNRGAERIIIGADGIRYYTGDHYKTFTKF